MMPSFFVGAGSARLGTRLGTSTALIALLCVINVPASAQNAKAPPPDGGALVRATQNVKAQLQQETMIAEGSNAGDTLSVPPAMAPMAEPSSIDDLATLPPEVNNATAPVTPTVPVRKTPTAAMPAADVTAPPLNAAAAEQAAAAQAALEAALAQEAARAAQNAAANEQRRKENEREQTQRAFDSAARGLFPLTNEQIKETLRRREDAEFAAIPPSYGQPTPEVAVETLNLDPGAPPPEIQVATGYVTTLTMLDASGQPWPIADIGVGGNFDIPPPEQGSHIVRITPLSRFGFGNLSIRMRDLSTPITFKLTAGGDVVHYRYDARIPMMGPNARVPLIQKSRITAGDDMIMAVLDNAIPTGSKKLKVLGTDKRTMAYRIGEKVYVRTSLSLLSPSWNASVSSADGTTVYEVGDTPVLLLSDNGVMVRARLAEDQS